MKVEVWKFGKHSTFITLCRHSNHLRGFTVFLIKIVQQSKKRKWEKSFLRPITFISLQKQHQEALESEGENRS